MPPEGYRPRKIFSLKEANQTLPLVSRIIQDIVRVNEEMRKTHERGLALAEEGRSVRAEAAQDQLVELGHQIEDLVDELEGIGCVCKDPVQGLVDFPARVGNRTVFLCWKLGEDQIRFWHELEAGFAGRKPVRGAFA